ncbi:MAG TPA: hypothetical protein VL225_17375 [Vicinamibacterales bacterium]|nr:hypothetical protein [Vicinamibacterales bacterium]
MSRMSERAISAALVLVATACGAMLRAGAEDAGDRWRLTPDGIEWPASEIQRDPRPHEDHIEMSGLRVSAIIQYGIAGTDRRLALQRRVVWPMLRTIPNDTHASLQHAFDADEIPALMIDGKAAVGERLLSAEIDGTLVLRTAAQEGVLVTHTIFPSRERAALVELIEVSNTSRAPVVLRSSEKGIATHTDPAKGVDGEYIIEAATDRFVDWTLAPNEARSYAIVYFARRAGDAVPEIDGARELDARRAFVAETGRRLVLETPDPVVNRAFAFAKIRATESIFATRGGLMHGPGGGRYYAAIWANDQAEYANPFFGFLGPGNPRESARNAFRHFARFMNPEYSPIPSSIIAEGTGTWHGAKDRGDQAMIAYGAGRFALASGDRAIAEEVWPLIEWCLEYLKRKTTSDGVIASDSDELENRFPAGKANLNTASLAYDALISAAMLGDALGKPPAATAEYRARAAALRAAIGTHFSATIDGFDTYRYYDGNTTLRAWITTPLTVGIYDRAAGTIDALFSPRLWTDDGLATEAGKPDFWDRSTLYALRGVFAAGDSRRGLEKLTAYTRRRLLGEHVPYAVEAYPEGGQAHLSAESALYCRIFVEGLFGIRPAGLNAFLLTPRLPARWDHMSLRAVHAFGRIFDVDVARRGDRLAVRIAPDRGAAIQKTIGADETMTVVF